MTVPSLRTYAQNVIQQFQIYFNTGEDIPEPSSWYMYNTVLLQEEQNLPLEMRLYLEWNPIRERSHGTWHWFAPHHVFRLPTEDSYLVAQCMDTKRWLTWNVHRRQWDISNKQLSFKTYPNIVEVIKNM